jgi:rhamnosyltransferase
VSAPAVSVIIRSRDEEAGIGRTLDLIAGQETDAEVEVIVVDSGSADRTVAIARGRGARLIEIPADSFTYGGALNDGCEAADGEILVALSAHAYPGDRGWLARVLGALADPRVACASGQTRGPDGERLEAMVLQDARMARADPAWGYSNAAGGFRAELWREHPFRADMPASEDREWALHWLERGRVAAIGPELVVEHDHSKDAVGAQFDRARRDVIGLAMAFGPPPPYGLRDLAREWWADQGSYRSAARARFSHRRAARLAGTWMGHRAARGTRA